MHDLIELIFKALGILLLTLVLASLLSVLGVFGQVDTGALTPNYDYGLTIF